MGLQSQTGLSLSLHFSLSFAFPKSKIIPDEEFKAFPLRSDIRQGCPLTPPLFNIILEVVAKCTKTKKEVKCIQIGKEDTKLPLFADD